MILLDANILLYAHREDAPQSEEICSWLEDLMARAEWIGLPWVSMWAFLRISTNPRLHTAALSPEEALGVLAHWLSLPNVLVVEPGRRHFELLGKIVTDYQVRGPLVTDAVLVIRPVWVTVATIVSVAVEVVVSAPIVQTPPE